MAEPGEGIEVARFYTGSRRFPKVIGRLPDGTRIIGGPYTIAQGVVLAGVLILGLTTVKIWGTGNPIVDIPLAVVIAWGAAWGAGRLPSTRRNMLSIAASSLSAMTRPTAGRYRAGTLKIRTPHYAGGSTSISELPEDIAASVLEVDVSTTPIPVASVPQPSPQQHSTAQPTPPYAKAVSGVERLLQQARGGQQ
ncbi:hypothetical protein ACPW96_18355 [Micromonospora sp. DT81.3]|uniref:hypothetical protein n=1 Tax=Micromonospora sp. DT81.3 TaxID=3416523 RepID=UPI003CFBB472